MPRRVSPWFHLVPALQLLPCAELPESPALEGQPSEPELIYSLFDAEAHWVEVHVGVPRAQFDLVGSLLQGAGVRVHVQTIGSGRWLGVGAMGAFSGVPTDFNAARILVVEDDADMALGVLEDADEGRLAIPGDDLPSKGIMARWGSSRVARLVLALFFVTVL